MPAFLLSPIARWLVVGVILLGLGAAWRVEAAGRKTAELRAVAAEAAVAGRDKAIKVLEASAADAAARAAQFQPIRRAVDAAPATSVCAAAPAVRAALDGLRARAAAATGGAALAAGVPAAAAGAGRAR